MSSKPPVPLGKKNGGFPKLVKPFKKSMLFKIKGKFSDDARKSKTMENVNSKNSNDNIEESLKTDSDELKSKAMKPKLKIPDLKFKPINSKSKNLSPMIKRLKTKPKLMDPKETETKLKKSVPLIKSIEMKENDDDTPKEAEEPKSSNFVKVTKFPKFEKSLKPMLKGLIKKNVGQSHPPREEENKTLNDRENFRQNKYYNNVNLLNSIKNKNLGLSKTKSIESNKQLVTDENNEETNNSVLKKYSRSFSKDKTENPIEDSKKSYATEKVGKNFILKKGIKMMFKGKKASFNNNLSKEMDDQKKNESIGTDHAESGKVHINNNGSNSNNNNALGSVKNKSKQVGPLTTYTESELLKNNNYMNAFSRIDGNYVGKVTGPPVTPLSMSDKIPQNENDLKCEYNQANNIYEASNNNNRFINNQLYASNFPIFLDPNNINWNNTNPMNVPFIFYPGLGCYSPVFGDGICSYIPMTDEGHNNLSNNKKEDILDHQNEDKERKNNSNKNKDKAMIAGGHLKPLQFRNGAEWSSEDEKLLNSDIAIYEGIERKSKKKEKEKTKERYIGDSKWYDIEHKLNNCRGVIENDNNKSSKKKKKKKNSDTTVNISSESDTKYSNGEDGFSSSYEKTYLEGETKNDTCTKSSSDEDKKCYKRSKRRSSSKKKSSNKFLEDEYDFNFDDLYKNYKIEYLNDKLKWANEYLKKKKECEKSDSDNDVVVKDGKHSNIGNRSLKKSNLKNIVKGKKENEKRLDDITHLFLPPPKKHENLFDLSLNFSKVDDSDKDDIINMLFLCRDLEKVIEEQHCILDMLDNDLAEVNNSLRLPPNWDNIHNFEILQEHILNENDENRNYNSLNDYDGKKNNGLVLNNVPLFIKGQVSLVPKNLSHFFDNTEKVPQTGKTFQKSPDIMNKKGETTNSTPTETYNSTNKYVPKYVKARVKAKVPLLLKGG
ncbi:conserved Plasmodium protein, unknown function [Plasmodium vinckei vinckei]|uniref:Uncharacterized protein n=1 Tax=Plasmodium vinckei vinckei TaxID=54757 RepID=A0A449BQN8_PLAVN|nr:conserved Plasmodium protein, unknown function [Plasmodium vinckei vinckei]VEV55754.1 conserved Plasmodium protein, unknown function [Plasmodium vinckei vinckei]